VGKRPQRSAIRAFASPGTGPSHLRQEAMSK